MKEVGTLQEIGAKPHDQVECVSWRGTLFKVGQKVRALELGGNGNYGEWRLTSRAQPAGPLRTVTRKEVVPGVYGPVGVAESVNDEIVVYVTNTRATDLDGVIDTLTAIRDALKEIGE